MSSTSIIQRICFTEDLSRQSLYFKSLGGVEIFDTYSARISEGATVSFATYFGSLPVGYWSKHTTIKHLELKLQTTGTVEITVYDQNLAGDRSVIMTETAKSGAYSSKPIAISQYSAGGWLWFEIIAKEVAEISNITWQTPDIARNPHAKASIAITTFNKPEYCIENIEKLSKTTELGEYIDCIFVVDQGTNKLVAQEGFQELKDNFPKLVLIEQANLGGSGGFSRGMLETELRGDSDYVLLLDDDIFLEIEAIFRAVRFARFASKPVIVGGHMLDIKSPTILHAYAEKVDLKPFAWGPTSREQLQYDLTAQDFVDIPWINQVYESDYNGWWMCLIPVELLKNTGYSMPVFIKWDDAEFGLRAKELGYKTVTLPGMAVWHVSWNNKDDRLDWQAFFHSRNRVIAGLLHSPYKKGGSLPLQIFKEQLKHLFMMQYYGVELSIRGLENLFEGPAAVRAGIGTQLSEALQLAGEFAEAKIQPQSSKLFEVAVKNDNLPELKEGDGPLGFGQVLFAIRHFFRNLLTKPKAATQIPLLTKRQAHWSQLPKLDEALVANATEDGWYHYRRNPKLFRDQLRRSFSSYRRLRKEWSRLLVMYREDNSWISKQSWIELYSEYSQTKKG